MDEEDRQPAADTCVSLVDRAGAFKQALTTEILRSVRRRITIPAGILVALHLDFRLCVFAGSIAAVEYVGVALAYLGTDTAIPEYELLTAPHPCVVKGAILISAVRH